MTTRREYYQQMATWPVITPGSLYPGRNMHILFRHDDWCAKVNRKGECNCNPDISCHLEPEDYAG